MQAPQARVDLPAPGDAGDAGSAGHGRQPDDAPQPQRPPEGLRGGDVGERIPTAASERPPPAAPLPDVRPRPRRRVLIASAAAVVLLGAVAGVTAALLGGRQQDPAPGGAAAQTSYHQVPVVATASSPASGEVRLTFSGGGPDVVGYLIYRLGPDGRAPGSGDGDLLDTGPLPGPSYEITGAEAGARHCFRVTALLVGAAARQQEPPPSATAACARADGRSSSKANSDD
jgi:hypothetical protein